MGLFEVKKQDKGTLAVCFILFFFSFGENGNVP